MWMEFWTWKVARGVPIKVPQVIWQSELMVSFIQITIGMDVSIKYLISQTPKSKIGFFEHKLVQVFFLLSLTEVLVYATLTVSYSFESTLLDSGSLGINATGTNVSYSTGRVNQSLAVLVTPSFVQVTGLVLLGTQGQAYSLAIWIKPTATAGGTIIHVSQFASGVGWCIPMLGFTSSGMVGVQGWNGSGVSLTGPLITANVWTHLAVTYGASNGIRMWVNGVQYGAASGGFTYMAATVPVIATLGSSTTGTGYCNTGTITMGQFRGYLDEFRLYSRELSSSDVSALANPWNLHVMLFSKSFFLSFSDFVT